jgi:hypothetical protein
MKKLLWIVILLPFFFFSTVNNITAADSNSTTGQCTNINNPEYHSLRPYPYQPCQYTTASYATFCGNNLTLQETVSGYYPGDGDCTTSGNTITCTFNKSIPSHKVSINLSGAELPFMGNTQDVKNSINTSDSAGFDNADKVNNYVSWYLNGTNYRAEYGGTPTGNDLINYSGPINKLLPGVILDAQRIQSIKNAEQNTNHNQIVACVTSNIPLIGNLLEIGHFNAIPCYIGNNTPAQGQTFRLNTSGLPLIDRIPIIKNIAGSSYGWDSEITWLRSITNIPPWLFNHLLNRLTEVLPPSIIKSMLQTAINDSISTAWNKAIPPLPWDDGTGKPFANNLLYLKAYYEWRGQTCIVIPIINELVCFENFLIPNKYADLFPYVPLSSTEDLEGNIKVDSAQGTGVSLTGAPLVTNVSFLNQNPATLFFPHLTESSQLGSLLQNTYVPQGQNKIGNPTEVSDQVSCNPVEVRSNPGDSLVNGTATITGDLSYNASFSCNFNPPPQDSYEGCMASCANSNQTGQCETQCSVFPPAPLQKCDKNVYITLTTESNSPKLDDIWSQLVAGPMAIVKRLFPKLGTQIGTIEDIPGSTNISYSGASANSGTLNLPHVGGIDEYFLKGIQTLLRPKGYGESISFGNTTTSSCSNGTTLNFPPNHGNCNLKSDILPGSSTNMPPTLKKMLEAAGQTYNVPPGLIVGIMYGEGLFNGGNKKDWTEENVSKWACQRVPGCQETGDDHFMGFNGSTWDNIKGKILPDLQKVNPGITNPDRCVLLDAIYGLAWNLHNSADGGMSFSCFGIDLNAPVPTSCDWNANQYESAIKVSESGYTNMCLTKENSCATGGGGNAACPNGDTCETITHRYPLSVSSHNACVWDIAHKY